MTIGWNENGYPRKHFEELRAARRYAFRAIAITGLPFVLLLFGTVFGPIPPIATAFAAANFLMFGLLGGLGSLIDTYRYVQVIPYFQRSLGGIDTFLAGRAIVRFLNQLDAIAIEQNVLSPSSFEFADDL